MTRTLLAGATALLSAGSAAAHTGAHGNGFATEIVHWLSSPVHSGGTILALVALTGAVIYIKRRKA